MNPYHERVTKLLSTHSSLPYAFAIVFKPHPQSKGRKRSAFRLIKWLLANKNKRGILSTHRRQLLDVLLFKVTEAESSKHKTRFQSQGALHCFKLSGKAFQECRRKAKLRHDHVYRRSKMIEDLEKAAPREIDNILKKAVACTVTGEENDRLSEFDKQYDGWDRYGRAKIKVKDTKTGKLLHYHHKRSRPRKNLPVKRNPRPGHSK